MNDVAVAVAVAWLVAVPPEAAVTGACSWERRMMDANCDSWRKTPSLGEKLHYSLYKLLYYSLEKTVCLEETWLKYCRLYAQEKLL